MPPASRSRRIVLFPFGQPESELHKDHCAQFFMALGGDVTRIIDEPSGLIDRFASYLQHIAAIVDGTERPIVVLTNTNPLALTVIAARRKLESAVPALRDATWVIFVDPAQDPFFVHTARAMGAFASRMPGSLKWTSPDKNTFLVATPFGVDIDIEKRGSRGSDPARVPEQVEPSAAPDYSFERRKDQVDSEHPGWDDGKLEPSTGRVIAMRTAHAARR